MLTGPPPDRCAWLFQHKRSAADLLASLLLRLQADYDEEPTKTINELLGSTLIEHLRDWLAEAERLRDDINAHTEPDGTR